MRELDPERLALLEARLGGRVPPDFLAALARHAPVREGRVAIVGDDGRVWSVRTTFSFDDDRPAADRLDRVYELVGDVLPPGALPVAEDWAGDLYCLMVFGPRAGQVVYWDHERDEGDDHADKVAESINEFFDRLTPDPDGDDEDDDR